MRTKRIPFDLARINEDNIKVVTRDGRSVRILCTDLKGPQKIAAATTNDMNQEYVLEYYANGWLYRNIESGADLFLEVLAKPRRMTNRELAWWLRDHPEEHREVRHNEWDSSSVSGYHDYSLAIEDSEANGCVRIRSNGGEWHEPLIEE